MTLQCETVDPSSGLTEAIAASIREVTKLRGEVAFAPMQSLANDGKVIDDIRKYT
jgi:phenylacetate-CoA ligase